MKGNFTKKGARRFARRMKRVGAPAPRTSVQARVCQRCWMTVPTGRAHACHE